jgi:hypothetical protein
MASFSLWNNPTLACKLKTEEDFSGAAGVFLKKEEQP